MIDYQQILDTLYAHNNLRSLHPAADMDGYVDLSSNDYLGLSQNVDLQKILINRLLSQDRFLMSNSSSRLVTGNSRDYDELEIELTKLYTCKKILVLGSGYLVNTGVLPALTSKGDLILADKLVHASIIDGFRLCECDWMRFRHNDLNHLEALLRKAGGRRVWVVTESIFSMDGDYLPLQELIALKKKYGFNIYLDEAHSFGVCGPNGAGCAVAANVDRDIDVLVGTFGKALASYGAFVATDSTMREVLINKMRTLIYSTALPPFCLQWSKMMVGMLPELEEQREYLRRLVAIMGGQSHIIPLVAGSNADVLKVASEMREAGFWVTPIRYPTVPRGQARVRISLNAGLMEDDIVRLNNLYVK